GDHERAPVDLGRPGSGTGHPGDLEAERRIDADRDPGGLFADRREHLLFAGPRGGTDRPAEADVMVREAVWVPNDAVPLVRIEGPLEVVGDPRFESFWSRELEGCYVPELLWRLAGKPRGVPIEGVRDDNRSALLTDRRLAV